MSDLTLTVTRHKNDDGWFFISSEDQPGLFLFGPDLEELLEEVIDSAALIADAQIKSEMAKLMGSIEAQLRSATATGNGWPDAGVPVKLPFTRPVAA